MSKNYLVRKYENNEKCNYGPLVYSVVGQVINRKTHEIELFILKCYPESKKKINSIELSFEILNPTTNKLTGYVTMSEIFYKHVYIKEQKIANAMIFHELGHFINRDVEKKGYSNENRRKALLDFKVLPEELKADEFAALELGYDAIIDGLKFMRGFRNSCINDRNYELAIREYDLRIEELNKQLMLKQQFIRG